MIPVLQPRKLLGCTTAFAVNANPLQPSASKGPGSGPLAVGLGAPGMGTASILHRLADSNLGDPTSLQPRVADFWEEGGSGARLFLAAFFRNCYFMPCQSDLMSVRDMREI